MISGIFFDAAGVLYLRHQPTASFAFRILQEKGYPLELSVLEQETLEELRLRANQGIAGYLAYWNRYLFLHGVKDPYERNQMIERIIDYSNDVQPAPGGPETLAELKQRGFAIGIVTDTMYPLEWKKRRLEKAGVAKYVDIIACSTDLGVHKPDPAIYQYATNQLGVPAQATAFVGHLSIELNGARAAGMITVAVNYDANATADYYCKSLSDLLSLTIFQGNLEFQNE